MDGKWLCWALLVVVASYSLVSVSNAEVEFSYCDEEESYSVQVKSVDINPYPVVRGQPATFRISAITEDTISGGKVKIEVYYFGIHVHSETHDLCTKTSCPIKEGSFVISNSQSLPGFTPPGAYKLRMKILDTDSSQLTCININFNIVPGSLVAENGIAATS